jgi:hypothetical protein
MRIRFFLSVIFIALTIGAFSNAFILYRLHRNEVDEEKAKLHRHGVVKVLSYHSDDGKDSIVTTTIQDTFRIK